MARIVVEQKRRTGPLWIVLALIVIAIVAWVLFGRSHAAATAAPAGATSFVVPAPGAVRAA
jgi:ABC-type polysaccharide/polyol phosphate export permease